MLVYRIEWFDGVAGEWLGVYQDLYDRMNAADLIENYQKFQGPQHPIPLADNLENFNHLHFGFISPEQLQKWFSLELLSILSKVGDYYIKIYHCSGEIKQGNTQICFDKDKSIVLKSIPVKENLIISI